MFITVKINGELLTFKHNDTKDDEKNQIQASHKFQVLFEAYDK